MSAMSLTSASIVSLDTQSTSKEAVVRELANLLFKDGRLSEIEPYLEAVAAREEHFPTGIDGGIAIPHAQSDLVLVPSVAVATSSQGIDFGADDGPSNLIFLIAAPASGENTHLEILATLARKVMHEEFRELLRSQTDPEQLAQIMTKEVGG